MSSSPKRLLRARDDRWVGGVCGGLGRTFDIDPNLVRLAFLIAFVAGGSGFLIYVILWIVMPESDEF